VLNVCIHLRERPDGSVYGYISTLGVPIDDQLIPIGSLDGSSASSSGADSCGAMLDVLDILGSRVANRLDQAILF
jgi:hypothetical protein